MSVLFTFPGQGSQRPGMLHALPDHPAASATLERAHAVLDHDPLQLDHADALASTVAVQLCLLIAGVATARVLAAEGARPDMVAGLSIGAWPAAVVAGVIDFDAALQLVALRGRLMEQAYPSGYGMAAIVGLGVAQLEPLIAALHTPAAPLHLANLNAPTQLVVAGADSALERLMECARRAGATLTRRLAMSVPSHCALLDAPAAQLAEALATHPLCRPGPLYLSGSRGRVLFEVDAIRDDLAFNMARQVRWHDTVRHAYERGARLALEMPSGNVLSGLTRPVFSDGRVLCCEHNRLDFLTQQVACAAAPA
nr:malonate decarboxylase subunit epsilon [uncultured Pseudogulbenkiania sp.]